MAARTLALFDLDDTLLAGDSDYEWGLFLAEIGAIDEAGYKARNDEFMAQYRAGTLDLQAFLAFQLCPLGQFSMAQLEAWHAQFMERKILPIVRPGSRALLDKHRGAVQVMVTATNEFVTAPIAAAFGIPALIATALERADGRFTGRTVGTPSFREGKVVRLKEWLASRGERLEDYARAGSTAIQSSMPPAPDAPVAASRRTPAGARTERGWPIRPTERTFPCTSRSGSAPSAATGALPPDRASASASGAWRPPARHPRARPDDWSPLGDFTVRAQAEDDAAAIGPTMSLLPSRPTTTPRCCRCCPRWSGRQPSSSPSRTAWTAPTKWRRSSGRSVLEGRISRRRGRCRGSSNRRARTGGSCSARPRRAWRRLATGEHDRALTAAGTRPRSSPTRACRCGRSSSTAPFAAFTGAARLPITRCGATLD